MEFKYKVGEKVTVLDGSEARDYTAGWVVSMNPYVGKTLEVRSQESHLESPVYKLVDGGGWSYDERYLAPANSAAPTTSDRIVIYIDKKDPSKVVAKDVSTGRTGVAKCSPEDTFDFYIGAKLAMDRLLEVEENKFSVGQLVIGNEGANRYSITSEKTVWRVAAIRQNGFIEITGPKYDTVGGFEVSPDCFDLYTGTLPSFKAFCTESKHGWQKGKIYSIVNGKCIGDRRYNPGYCISAEQMSDTIGTGFIRVME